MRWLGVLMLETRFPRLPGDVGHPDSFSDAGAPPGGRRCHRHGAWCATPIRHCASRSSTRARALVDEGATAITTSCGFLARWQHELQDAVAVPVWTSSLLALPGLAAQRPGIITVDAAALGPAVLQGAGADAGTPVEGLDPDSALRAHAARRPGRAR